MVSSNSSYQVLMICHFAIDRYTNACIGNQILHIWAGRAYWFSNRFSFIIPINIWWLPAAVDGWLYGGKNAFCCVCITQGNCKSKPTVNPIYNRRPKFKSFQQGGAGIVNLHFFSLNSYWMFAARFIDLHTYHLVIWEGVEATTTESLDLYIYLNFFQFR